METKLQKIAEEHGSAEDRLESGAAALASSWFGGDTTTTTALRGNSTAAAEADDVAASKGKSAAAVGKHLKRWYRVYITTIVRQGEALDSPQVSVVPAGVFVRVVEWRGRRVRVDQAATDLTHPQQAIGWLSLVSSDDVQILRAVDEDELPKEYKGGSFTDRLEQQTQDMETRERAEDKAIRIAKMTAYQRAINNKLQAIDPKKAAKSLIHLSTHSDEVEDKAIHEAGKAGEHVVDTLAKGADAILGKLDTMVGDDDGGDAKPVKPIHVDMSKVPVKGILGIFKGALN